MWGDEVRRDGVVGWGDVDARGCALRSSPDCTPELKNQPDGALGLSEALCSICRMVNTPSPEGVEKGLAYGLGVQA